MVYLLTIITISQYVNNPLKKVIQEQQSPTSLGRVAQDLPPPPPRANRRATQNSTALQKHLRHFKKNLSGVQGYVNDENVFLSI